MQKNSLEDKVVMWPVIMMLALLPLIPLLVLIGRDMLYSYLQIPNTETPQGNLYAWELWVIAGVCWLSALGVLVVHKTPKVREAKKPGAVS